MQVPARRLIWATVSACLVGVPLVLAAAEEAGSPTTGTAVVDATPPGDPAVTQAPPEVPPEPPPIPVTPKPRKLWEGDDGALYILNRAQFRWTDDMPDDTVHISGTSGPGKSKGFFRIRRAKTQLTGWVWKKELTYEVQLSWAGPEPGASTQTPLEDLALSWDASKDGTFKITFGQFKVPFGRQEMTSSGRMQFCDRDFLSFEFTRGRDIGLQFEGELAQGKVEYAAGVFNGNAASHLGNDNDKYQYDARVMWEPWGKVGYSESDFQSKDKPLLALAAEFEHNDQRGSFTSSGPISEFETVILGGDVVFKYKGFSAFAEYFSRKRDPETGASFHSDGWHAQAGYFLKRDVVEAAVRYARWDPSDQTSGDDQIEQGAALNYFLRKHGLKLQADFRQIENRVQKTKNKELRFQTQLMF